MLKRFVGHKKWLCGPHLACGPYVDTVQVLLHFKLKKEALKHDETTSIPHSEYDWFAPNITRVGCKVKGTDRFCLALLAFSLSDEDIRTLMSEVRCRQKLSKENPVCPLVLCCCRSLTRSLIFQKFWRDVQFCVTSTMFCVLCSSRWLYCSVFHGVSKTITISFVTLSWCKPFNNEIQWMLRKLFATTRFLLHTLKKAGKSDDNSWTLSQGREKWWTVTKTQSNSFEFHSGMFFFFYLFFVDIIYTHTHKPGLTRWRTRSSRGWETNGWFWSSVWFHSLDLGWVWVWHMDLINRLDPWESDSWPLPLEDINVTQRE